MNEGMKTIRPRGTDSAVVIQVIRTRSLSGIGTKEDPCRILTQYWDFDGVELARHDPNKASAVIERQD